jgi:hypothetical protein
MDCSTAYPTKPRRDPSPEAHRKENRETSLVGLDKITHIIVLHLVYGDRHEPLQQVHTL